MAVRVTNSQKKIRIPAGRLKRAAELVLSSLGFEGAELCVLITGDRKMRSLNRRYRGMDRTTDVLSFSMYEGCGAGIAAAESGPGLPPLVLGDIVISAPKATAQAAERGHGLEDELIFLLVHGMLHLAGYDHEAGEAGRRRMERRQKALLESLKGR